MHRMKWLIIVHQNVAHHSDSDAVMERVLTMRLAVMEKRIVIFFFLQNAHLKKIYIEILVSKLDFN